jgi:hypothetical protein
VLLLVLVQPAWGSDKKGVALRDSEGTKINSLNVAWHYNWRPASDVASLAGCFVPMIWGKQDQVKSLIASGKGRPPGDHDVLLLYNEPDFARQSNRSVEDVLAEWPAMSKLAARVSSPAAGRPFGPWMKAFMSGARRHGLKVDFLAVHWYGAPDSKRFLAFVDRAWHEYGLPIWITEFAMADYKAVKYQTRNRFDRADAIRFMADVLPELDRRPYVERYAWLGTYSEKESLRSSLLFDARGQLTDVGRAYARLRPSAKCKLH